MSGEDNDDEVISAGHFRPSRVLVDDDLANEVDEKQITDDLDSLTPTSIMHSSSMQNSMSLVADSAGAGAGARQSSPLRARAVSAYSATLAPLAPATQRRMLLPSSSASPGATPLPIAVASPYSVPPSTASAFATQRRMVLPASSASAGAIPLPVAVASPYSDPPSNNSGGASSRRMPLASASVASGTALLPASVPSPYSSPPAPLSSGGDGARIQPRSSLSSSISPLPAIFSSPHSAPPPLVNVDATRVPARAAVASAVPERTRAFASPYSTPATIVPTDDTRMPQRSSPAGLSSSAPLARPFASPFGVPAASAAVDDDHARVEAHVQVSSIPLVFGRRSNGGRTAAAEQKDAKKATTPQSVMAVIDTFLDNQARCMALIEEKEAEGGEVKPVAAMWEFGDTQHRGQLYGPIGGGGGGGGGTGNHTALIPAAHPPAKAATKKRVQFVMKSDIAKLVRFAQAVLFRSNIRLEEALQPGVLDDTSAITELGDTIVNDRGNLRAGVEAEVALQALIRDDTGVCVGAKEARGIIRSGVYEAYIPSWCRDWSLLQHISTSYNGLDVAFEKLAYHCIAKAKHLSRPGVTSVLRKNLETFLLETLAVYVKAKQAGPPGMLEV